MAKATLRMDHFTKVASQGWGRPTVGVHKQTLLSMTGPMSGQNGYDLNLSNDAGPQVHELAR